MSTRPRLALLLLCALGGAAPATVRAQEPAPSGPLVSLPPLLVETEGGPRWKHGTAPGVEVLTCCDDETSREFVEGNYRQEELLNDLVAPDLQMRTSAPLVLILYDERYKAALAQEVVDEMNRMSPKARVGGAALPGASLVPHLRLSDPDSTAIYLILQETYPVPSVGRSRDPGASDASAYDNLAFSNDYVATLLDGRTPELPPWFRAGVMQLYRDMSFAGSEIEIAPLAWISDSDRDFLANTPAYGEGLLPAAELFTPAVLPAAGSDPLPVRARAWAAEAALFVRWGLDGRDHPRREALWRFARESSAAPATDEMFRRCFGFGYAQLPAELEKYLAGDAGRTLRWAAPAKADRPRLSLHEATPAEIREIKGDWGRRVLRIIARDHPELMAGYAARARQALLDAYSGGDRSPGLLASLGQLYFQAGDRFQARAYLEAAVQAGVGRPLPYDQLAQLRLLNALGENRGRLAPADLASILAPLSEARRLEPALPEGYLLLAAAWQHSAAQPRPADLVPLNEGARLFHRNRPLVLAAAALDLGAGDRASAAELIGLALASAPEAEFRRALLAFQADRLGTPLPGRN